VDSHEVLVNGATGKMGQEVCKAIQNAPNLTLVGGVILPEKAR